jgi:hypothetical protein
MQRSVLLRRLGSVARTRAVLVMLLAVAPVVVAGCTSGHQGEALPATTSSPSSPPSTSSPSSTPMPSPASIGTAGPRSTAAPVTTVPPSPAVLHLLADLRSVPFQSPLPPHLHVRGVGTWTYVDAGHVGSGYIGSAQVMIRSSIEGETVTAIYDLFTAASQARVEFNLAESDFSRYSPAKSFRLLQLRPAVSAFCGPQPAPANTTTTTCWFDYTVTNGIVTTTAPPVYGGDGPAVLQAMLSHVLALSRAAK